MDMRSDRRRPEFGDNLPRELEFENTLSATGLWFAVAVLLAFLLAGIIIFRAAAPDQQTADAFPAAAQPGPFDPVTIR